MEVTAIKDHVALPVTISSEDLMSIGAMSDLDKTAMNRILGERVKSKADAAVARHNELNLQLSQLETTLLCTLNQKLKRSDTKCRIPLGPVVIENFGSISFFSRATVEAQMDGNYKWYPGRLPELKYYAHIMIMGSTHEQCASTIEVAPKLERELAKWVKARMDELLATHAEFERQRKLMEQLKNFSVQAFMTELTVTTRMAEIQALPPVNRTSRIISSVDGAVDAIIASMQQ